MEIDRQQKLFDIIKSQYENSTEMIEELEDVLNVSQSSVYKRLRGDVSITIDELAVLLEHYDIDSKRLFNSTDETVELSFSNFDNKIKSTKDFLLPIYHDLVKINEMPNAKVMYVSVDIPLFYNFLFENIALFKFHVYHNTIWNKQKTKMQPFAGTSNGIDSDTKELMKKMVDLYQLTDSIEIWSGEFFHNTVNQIKYFLDANLFVNRKDALNLIQDLYKVLGRIEAITFSGNKLPAPDTSASKGRVAILHNTLYNINNIILIKAEDFQSVYFTHDNPNFFHTTDIAFFKRTEKWLRELSKNLENITHSTYKRKKAFFEKQKAYLIRQEEEIMELIG